METKTALNISEVLPNKKVVLMPVPRQGKMIKDPKHKGYFMFDGAKRSFILPRHEMHGSLVPLFNEEERMFFEERLGVDLNFYKPKDNFWFTFEVVITKTDDFMENGLVFNLSDPMDNLRWRLLLANKNSVAPDWESRYDNGEYQFAFREIGFTDEVSSKRIDLLQEVFRHFNKYLTSAQKMYEFLNIYWMETNKAKKPPEGSEIGTYKAILNDIIENDPEGYLLVARDKDKTFDIKAMILKAMKVGIIERTTVVGDFQTAEGKYLGKGLNDAVKSLKSPEYNEILTKIEAQITAIG